MPHFSHSNRAQTIQNLQKQDLDLIVIGGGITGAGIALDAASRGLKVALLEKEILPLAPQVSLPNSYMVGLDI